MNVLCKNNLLQNIQWVSNISAPQPKGQDWCCFFRLLKNSFVEWNYPFFQCRCICQDSVSQIYLSCSQPAESQLVFLKLILNEDIVKASPISVKHHLFLFRVTGVSVPAAKTRGRTIHWTGHQSTHHSLTHCWHANSAYKYGNHLAMRQWCGFYYVFMIGWIPAGLKWCFPAERPHI